MKNKFMKEWVEYYTNLFLNLYPEIDKNKLKDFLKEIFKQNVKNHKGELHNNYIHKSIPVDLLSIIDWIDNTKPITAGFGVFFKNQEQSLNPAAVMLINFMKLRKKYKDKLKDYKEDSYEYASFDRSQLNEKINSNSFYGAGGAPTSNFFNLYTATSITGTSQSLISTTQQAFEYFLASNITFINLDECFLYINNILKEKTNIDDSFLDNKSINTVYKRLCGLFLHYDNKYDAILKSYLSGLNQNQLNKIYYKNNLYAFSLLPKIRYKLGNIISKVNEFKNPNKIPDNIKNEIEDLWSYYKEFVFYNHSPFGRIDKLKYYKRKSAIVIDTDSNMLNLNPWVEFLDENIISINNNIKNHNKDNLIYISINIMAYILTNMITCVLNKYTKDANILKDYRSRINMKNEYLFARIILSTTKKRYLVTIKLREGKEIIPMKTDIKGMDFIKSTTREETKEYFTKLAEEELLHAKVINISNILKKLEEFEDIIRKSLTNREKNFLIPKSVKELEAYKDCYKEQGVRSIIAWNYLYPENTISLPEKVDMIKVKMSNENEIEPLRNTNPDLYNKIVKNIFNNPEKKIAEKGIQVLAIPRNIKLIPEWLMPYIDYDTIINDNISRFYSVLESLGIELIKTSKKHYFSNIIKI